MYTEDERKEARRASSLKWWRKKKTADPTYVREYKKKRRKENLTEIQKKEREYYLRIKDRDNARRTEYNRKWIKDNPFWRYKITKKEFEALLLAQDGKCAICGGGPGNRKKLSVDHCHDSGENRGLLCQACNSGIGFFREDPKRLIRAAEYLTKHYYLKFKALLG